MTNLYSPFLRQNELFNFKNWILFLSLLTGMVRPATAQCPMGNITLTTQAEVNNFSSSYPGCTHVMANLSIGPSIDIANLNGLSGVQQIDGGLIIYDNAILSNATGLANLTSIGTGIYIGSNPGLSSIDMSGVSAMHVDYMAILSNSSLTTALLPTDVTTISTRLQYYNNPVLATISEMNNLTTVGDYLSISHVLANTLPAFSSLTTIGTSVPSATSGLYLDNNPNITAIPAFTSLNSIGGLISIQANQNLTDFDLSAVATHDIRILAVRDNPVLTSGLLPTDVSAVSDYFQYYNNPMLASISEMNSLTTVEDHLSISQVLASTLPAFASLTEIGTKVPSGTSGLYLDNNPNITAIPTFASLTSIGGLISIQANPNLTGFDLSTVATHNIRIFAVIDNPVLTTALLPTDVTTISMYLQYYNNPMLEVLSEMDNLASIDNYLSVSNLAACHIPDFPSLSFIGNMMVYGDNPNLTVLPRLASNAVINTQISIVNNPALSYCAIDALCDFLQGAGIRYISNNANGCQDESAVTASCIANTPYPAATCPQDLSVCISTLPLDLTGLSALPAGGTFSGIGTSAGMFHPDAAGLGAHTITYTYIGVNNCISSCMFTITVVSCPVKFSGQIKFSNDNTLGVKNATVSLTGSATGSNLSDIGGYFIINTALNTGSFTLKPTKTVNKLNGVTVADVTAIQQHVSATNPITDPYKLVSADINKSNSITMLDATVLNQALLGNPGALAIFSSSWRFVPTSHAMLLPPWGFPEQRTYTNVSGAQTNQDFYGIKIGDVVPVYANPANFGAGAPLVLRAADRLLHAGETFVVDFSADQLNDLAAFQFALAFDPARLQFIAADPLPGLPLGANNFGVENAANGKIRVVWSQAAGFDVPEATPAFRLHFKALESGARLSELLQPDDEALPTLTYNSALLESPLWVIFGESTGTVNPSAANGVQLFQNRPNPFAGTTAIGFVLPEACDAQLRVFDASGRILAERKALCPAGKNEAVFDLGSAEGVLYYELTTPFGVLARKMVAVGN